MYTINNRRTNVLFFWEKAFCIKRYMNNYLSKLKKSAEEYLNKKIKDSIIIFHHILMKVKDNLLLIYKTIYDRIF